jgi:hypothetical protein
VTPDRLLRDYFHAKDENRPHLLAAVFADDATLRVVNRSATIDFPAQTSGRDAIADVLVRRFNETYENIRSFYLDRPKPDQLDFSCDWLVGMTEKASRTVRVGCGRYDWRFRDVPPLRVVRLVITIEAMVILDPAREGVVMQSLARLAYPWTSASAVVDSLCLPGLEPLGTYLGRRAGTADR